MVLRLVLIWLLPPVVLSPAPLVVFGIPVKNFYLGPIVFLIGISVIGLLVLIGNMVSDSRAPLSPFFNDVLKHFVTDDDFYPPTPHIYSLGELLYKELARISASSVLFEDVSVCDESHPCISPVSVSYGRHVVRFPCGACLLCRQKQTNVWLNRFRIESIDSFPLFITLTYDDVHVSVLSSRDYQRFLKRLRYFKAVFTYSVIGEYGPQTGRPHFHLLCFFRSPVDESELTALIRQCWPYGAVDIKHPTDNHLYYIAGYKKDTFLRHESFRRFSNKSPLGRSSAAARDLIDFTNTFDSSAPGSDSGIRSPISLTRDLVKYGVISEDLASERVDNFLSERDFCNSLNTVYSVDFLYSYILSFVKVYEKFLSLKL